MDLRNYGRISKKHQRGSRWMEDWLFSRSLDFDWLCNVVGFERIRLQFPIKSLLNWIRVKVQRWICDVAVVGVMKIDFNRLMIVIYWLVRICSHRYGREYADPYAIGHGVGPVPGGYGVRRGRGCMTKKVEKFKGRHCGSVQKKSLQVDEKKAEYKLFIYLG